MKVSGLERSIGAHVGDVVLEKISPADFDALYHLVNDRHVVVVRGQNLSEPEQVRFAGRFGPLQCIFIKEALSQRYPELFFVSNVIEDGKPVGNMDAGRHWHTDGAYLSMPHNVSMLYAVEVPRNDAGAALGNTDFIDMTAAYDALSEQMKAQLEGLRALHDVNHRYALDDKEKGMLVRTAEFAPVSHPLVIRHPETGRRCLYVSEGYTCGVEGLSAEESGHMLKSLFQHMEKPAFRYSHSWAEGDLLIWDNRATLHRATFDYKLPQRRLMRRATVAGAAFG